MRADRRIREISLEAATLLTEGKLSEAVRVVRETEGVSTREARKRVDAHIANDPMLGVQLDALRRESRRKLFCVSLFVVVSIAGAAIYARYFAPH